MAACVALACATASGPGPDLATGPETWANPLAELTRIVGRENVEHRVRVVLFDLEESGLRENFVPEVFRIIHSSRDTIEHVSEAAMNHLHDLIVALVLELDRSL